MGENILSFGAWALSPASGSVTELHSIPSVPQLLSRGERLGHFLAFGLRQARVAYTLFLALSSLSSQPVFK